MPLTPASRRALLAIACRALRQGLGESTAPEPAPDDPALLEPAGCFVSLHEQSSHQLRGCVGRLDARSALWETVRHTARDVLRDPRFVTSPVRADELTALEIEISILSAATETASPLDFEPLIDGIYLVHEGKAGFFLPQVARQTGWTRQQLLQRLCTEKLGIHAAAWNEPDAKLYTFAVEIVGPERIPPEAL
jgi:AmmeMemoRadiSam system protein A